MIQECTTFLPYDTPWGHLSRTTISGTGGRRGRGRSGCGGLYLPKERGSAEGAGCARGFLSDNPFKDILRIPTAERPRRQEPLTL